MAVVNKLLDKITEYIKLKGEKLKLEIIGHVARLLAHFVAFLLIGLTGFFLFSFASITMGAYLNELLQSAYLGYLIMTGVYLVIVIIIFILLKARKLQNWLEILFIRIAQESTDEDE